MSRTPACFLLLLLLTAASFAEDKKPKCNKQSHGRYWPDEANEDPKLAQTMAKSGELELCLIKKWRYVWEPTTIRYWGARQKRDGKARSSGSAVKADSSD